MRYAALAASLIGILTLATAHAQTDDPARTRRTLPSATCVLAPVIDGSLDDSVWQSAPKAGVFTDRQTGKLAPDQTSVSVLYDTEAIYLGFDCQDSAPDSVLGRETVRDSRYQRDGVSESEDSIEVRLDPFLTYKGNDFARFSVNPLGTRSARIGGGRAGKAEWNGEWTAAARRTPTGWTAEMRIPWRTLNYPAPREKGGAIAIGLNFFRYQYRTRIESVWSDIGQQEFHEREGRWMDVCVPRSAFRPTLSLLPYFLPSGSASNVRERSGIDARYTVTPDLTLVASANPDFATVEGAVQNIAFSRSEQFLPERRPFFLEGGDFFEAGTFYSLGPLFYSNRIPLFDVGAKGFGKLTPRDTVGVLTTMDFGNRADVVGRYRHELSPTSNVGLFFTQTDRQILGETRAADPRRISDRNGVLALLSSNRWGKTGFETQSVFSAGNAAGGRAGQLNLTYSDGSHFTSLQYLNAAPTFRNANGLVFFTDYKGFAGYHNWSREFRTGGIRSFGVDFGPRYDWHYDGRPFRRGGNIGVNVQTRSDLEFGLSTDYIHFDQQLDRTIGGSVTVGQSNRFRKFGVDVRTGSIGGTAYRSFSPGASVRILGRLDLSYNGFLQRFDGWQKQHVLTSSYEISPTRSIGGRLVTGNDGQGRATNGYLSFRNAGEAGTEIYFLLGDPNVRTFATRAALKFVFAI